MAQNLKPPKEFVRGLAIGLSIFLFSQLWAAHENNRLARAALFTIRSEINQNDAVLDAVVNEMELSRVNGTLYESRTRIANDLSTAASDRNLLLIADQDMKFTESLITYNVEITLLRRLEATSVSRDEEAQRQAKDLQLRDDALAYHRDFLIVNRDKLKDVPNLLRTYQTILDRTSKAERKMKQADENIRKLEIERLALRINGVKSWKKAALAAIEAMVAHLNLSDSKLLLYGSFILIVVLFSALPTKDKTEHPNVGSPTKGDKNIARKTFANKEHQQFYDEGYAAGFSDGKNEVITGTGPSRVEPYRFPFSIAGAEVMFEADKPQLTKQDEELVHKFLVTGQKDENLRKELERRGIRRVYAE